jgi:ribosomal protein L11 methyltransferase
MNYFEIKLTFNKVEPWKEIFTSLLADAGCESFMDGENENILLAYIAENVYNPLIFKKILESHEFDVKIKYSISKIESQDWNALWESNYSPVLIGNRCFIHAPFHKARPDVDYNIVIEPKMSFGTAHHETTLMMIEFLLEEDVAGKSFLDMGSGTGILAILAHKKGANPILAVDNDDWAYRNNIENNSRNNANAIDVKLGDASIIKDSEFDIIFANINRNILYEDIPIYSSCLKKGGILFLSGFYFENDLKILEKRCRDFQLRLIIHKEKNRWAAAKFRKE